MIYVPRHLKNPIDTFLYNSAIHKIEPKLNLIGHIRKIVRDETGADPYMDPKYRGVEYVTSRQLFLYFVRRYCNLSLYETGKLLNKDHATVVHAEKSVKKFKDIEMDYKGIFDAIEKRILQIKK